jgi:aminoglycoside phosphotransferase (APT) family kinase protein
VINEELVGRLIASQFPQWKDLPVCAVKTSGWDNRTFHLGDEMLVRLPSEADYELQVEKEQRWLPRLAPHLPFPISTPLAMGQPGEGYPWEWSIYRWLEGETASVGYLSDLNQFARDLAQFLIALHRIETLGGPEAGPHSFFRGGALSTYDAETRKAIDILKDKIDGNIAMELWEAALATQWEYPAVWVHGDLSVGNLLVKDGKLCAVIDFGQLAVGDPACDLAITWTFFKDESRQIFKNTLVLDEGTWARGRAWALWKALIMAAGLCGSNAAEAKEPWRIIDEVIVDYKEAMYHASR